MEALLQTLPNPLAAQMDAMEREETFDPADNARPLLDQVLTLSLDPFCILFFNSRKLDVARHFVIARKPCRSVRVIPSASSRSVFARRPLRGIRKLAGSKTMVRMPRAISSLASQNPS